MRLFLLALFALSFATSAARHRENLLIKGARRVGAAYVDNPKSPYREFWAMVITD